MKMMDLVGIILIITGVFFIVISRFDNFLGKLPGDIHFSHDNFSFHFPITTSIILSIVLSIVLTILVNLFIRR